jgi:hypothetical protein
MKQKTDFSFSRHPKPWLGGEPRVFTVMPDDSFPQGRDLQGARLLTVAYDGGGLVQLFNQIAKAADVPVDSSYQALLEHLGDMADKMPLVLYVQHADRLLADVGPALIAIMASWEKFARHGTGVHAMYLVVDIGPRATVDAAFWPGGKVDWR